LVNITFGNVDVATGVALQSDGKIVVGGFTNFSGANNFAAARLTADGTLDTTFNEVAFPIFPPDDGNGRVSIDFTGADQAKGLAIDPNGRIVLAGSTSAGNSFAVARLMGTVEKGLRLAVGGGLNGRAQLFMPDSFSGAYVVGGSVGAFGTIVGVTVHTAVGDVNGDKFPDTILVTGPGTAIRFAVVSGADNATLLVPPTAPFVGSESFTGGGFVASADLDHDGHAEIIVSPDRGGGPRVTIFSRNNDGTLAVRANFFGIDDAAFRGGCRTALGDVNGDGNPDMAVCAGFLGGPRTALFNGTTLFGGTPTRLVGDFFAFPGTDAVTLRNGVFVAIGDVNGDGFADLIFGGGPGGAPRVFILSGQTVSGGDVAGAQASPVANFFVAANASDRGGVRVAAVDADGDGRAELAAGSGEGSPAQVRVYLGKNFTSTGEPATFQDLDLFASVILTDGVFVG